MIFIGIALQIAGLFCIAYGTKLFIHLLMLDNDDT